MLKKAYQGKPVVAVEDREEKPEKKILLEALISTGFPARVVFLQEKKTIWLINTSFGHSCT